MRTKLVLARKNKGLTQDQVAEQIGVTKSFVSYIENGRMNPSLKVAFDIAKLYGIEIDPTGKIFKAFSFGRLSILPIKDLYHVSSVLGVEFDSNEIFKEDAE